jgi:hypothetical protein
MRYILERGGIPRKNNNLPRNSEFLQSSFTLAGN